MANVRSLSDHVYGDGSVMYPGYNVGVQGGVASIRMECIRDGVEDFDMLKLAEQYLGRDFVIKTVIGAGIVTVFVQVFAYLPVLTENITLNVVFGSIVYGFGIGLTLISGGSTGGTDILGRLIQYKLPSVRIGSAMLVCDFAVIFASLLVFKNIDLAMYGIIALVASSLSINFLIRALNVSKLAFVITTKKELSKQLVSTSPRGVTVVDVVGGYTGVDKLMLICALKAKETPSFQARVLAVDPEAFIIFSESEQIVGNGFYVYR
jgi:uncharacterized membrane-anchored protein YitT (DUF2179 family)